MAMSSPAGAADELHHRNLPSTWLPDWDSARGRWIEFTVLAAIVASVFLVYLTQITPGEDSTSTDWVLYVTQARNIVDGHPFGESLYVYQPEARMYGASTYPPGYSLLLAPVYAAFGVNLKAFKVVSDVVLALALVPVYWCVRRHLGTPAGWLLTLALGFSYPFIALQNHLSSDGLFLLLSFWTLAVLLRIYGERKDETAPWLWGAAAGLLAAAACITRPIGFALILAMGAYEIVRRRRITRFAMAFGAVFTPVIVLDHLLAHSVASSAEQFVLSIPAMVRHLAAYATLFSYLFSNPLSHGLRYVLWAAATALAIAGMLATLRAVNPIPLLYSAAMLGVLGVYWIPNPRYLAPLLPIYLIYAGLGGQWLVGRLPRGMSRLALAVGVAAVLAVPAINAVTLKPDTDSLITAPAFQSLSGYMRAHTSGRELTVFWNARVLALASDRPSSAYPRVVADGSESTAESVLRYLDRVRPAYVVLDDGFASDERRLAEAIAMAPARFPMVYQNERFRLMRYVAP
jgi:4-amino-4-deoxy-L-arabinose transferase-like glycosyltransferase